MNKIFTTTKFIVKAQSTDATLKAVPEMPYADKEKQKKYCRDYQTRQRALLKKLKLEQSVQKDVKQ